MQVVVYVEVRDGKRLCLLLHCAKCFHVKYTLMLNAMQKVLVNSSKSYIMLLGRFKIHTAVNVYVIIKNVFNWLELTVSHFTLHDLEGTSGDI